MMDAIKGDAQVDDQLTFNQLIGDWALALPQSSVHTSPGIHTMHDYPACTHDSASLPSHFLRSSFLHSSGNCHLSHLLRDFNYPPQHPSPREQALSGRGVRPALTSAVSTLLRMRAPMAEWYLTDTANARCAMRAYQTLYREAQACGVPLPCPPQPTTWLQVHAVPASTFCSAHVYHVQQNAQARGCLVLHLTFVEGWPKNPAKCAPPFRKLARLLRCRFECLTCKHRKG